MPDAQLDDIFYFIVNICVLKALSCIIKNFGLDCDIFKSHFTAQIEMTLVKRNIKVLLHDLVHTW